MPVTVKRFGGLAPRPPRERSFSLNELDTRALEEIRRLSRAPKGSPQRVADGFTYKFEVNEPNQHAEFALSGPQVPDALRKLLP